MKIHNTDFLTLKNDNFFGGFIIYRVDKIVNKSLTYKIEYVCEKCAYYSRRQVGYQYEVIRYNEIFILSPEVVDELKVCKYKLENEKGDPEEIISYANNFVLECAKELFEKPDKENILNFNSYENLDEIFEKDIFIKILYDIAYKESCNLNKEIKKEDIKKILLDKLEKTTFSPYKNQN